MKHRVIVLAGAGTDGQRLSALLTSTFARWTSEEFVLLTAGDQLVVEEWARARQVGLEVHPELYGPGADVRRLKEMVDGEDPLPAATHLVVLWDGADPLLAGCLTYAEKRELVVKSVVEKR